MLCRPRVERWSFLDDVCGRGQWGQARSTGCRRSDGRDSTEPCDLRSLGKLWWGGSASDPVGNLAISSRPMRLMSAKCLNQNMEHSRHALCLSIARLARSFLTVWAASRSYQQLRGAGNGRESWAHAWRTWVVTPGTSHRAAADLPPPAAIARNHVSTAKLS